MALIYWIHLRENENYLTDGYIGITERELNDRMEEHRVIEHSSDIFQDMIDYHGWDNLIKEVIYVNDICECRSFEYYLRPKTNIGWNTAAGGGMPPSRKGKSHTIESKTNMSLCRKGKKFTDTVKLNMSISRKNNPLSNESRNKLSNLFKGVERTIETKNKISASKKGKKASIETKTLMSKSRIMYPKNYYLEIPFIKSNIEISKNYNLSNGTIKSIKSNFKKGVYNWIFEEAGITL